MKGKSIFAARCAGAKTVMRFFGAVLLAMAFAREARPAELPRLKISFWIWALYDMQRGGVYADLDARMKEAVDRGFNCIRLDDGAGLFNRADGSPRGTVRIHPPFGKFSADIRQMPITSERTVNPAENLVEFVRAADCRGLWVILSSWYYLHTNWFLDEEINRELNEGMSIDRKFSYFADELGHALSLLRARGLLHRVAYAELFNEFDGLPFAGRYAPVRDAARAAELRRLHEEAIGRLKRKFPDVRFAYDASRADFQAELVPRNADVIAFHDYYFWDVYAKAFEGDGVRDAVDEIPIPSLARPYLTEKPFSIADVVGTRNGNLRTGNDWNARVRLYSSLDSHRIPELERTLEGIVRRDWRDYLAKFKRNVDRALVLRAEVAPAAALVFSEGVSYCASNRLLFEERSDDYWRMLMGQQDILKAAGVRGSVLRTTNGPEDPSWLLRSWDVREANARF